MNLLQEQYQKWDPKTLYLYPPKKLNKEQLILWKIKYDKKWYIEKFLKIKNKQAQMIPFKFNKAQNLIYKEWLNCLKNGIPPKFIVLKSRQQGISTWAEGMIFADTANNELKSSYIIAHEGDASSNLFSMSKLFYDELPQLIKPMRSRNNQKALIFENPNKDAVERGDELPGLRSKYAIGTANVGEAGRSGTNHNLHISECAFFPNPEKTVAGLMQTIPDGLNTLMIMESTANGIGGFFHDAWIKAVTGSDDLIPIFLPWSFDPTCTREFKTKEDKNELVENISRTYTDYKGDEVRTEEWHLMEEYNLTWEQLNWRRWAIANKCLGDINIFKQEYPINDQEAFLSSGRPKFDIGTLREYRKACSEPVVGYLDSNIGTIKFRDDERGYVKIWEKPERRKNYYIGADVAEGLEKGDFSSMYVMDDSFNIVAAWHGHIDPDLFGIECVKLARYYGDAFLAVENNNHGLTTLKAIQRLEYWNIFHHKNVDKITDTITTKMGWTTKQDTKRLMIDKLAEFIRERYIKMKDKDLIGELMSYIIEPSGSTNAQLGCFDDRVMSLAITLQMALQGLSDVTRPERPVMREDINNKKEVSV